ncbi:MAG TPA: TIGR03084 family metal-binding protein [Dehalococcoidia bacterium]|nr:TIGR03084 family metal-binding protein [Dehalococcoidia bacterium]
MTTKLDEIIDDLAAEHAALEKVLVGMPPGDWDKPSHSPGWSARDQVSHLAYFDETAALAIKDAEAFAAEVREAMAAGPDFEKRYLERGRAMTPAGVLEWWQTASRALIQAAGTLDPDARVPWYGPAMSAASFITARLMETWSHGLDVVDTVGADRPDTDRLRHVAYLGFRTRAYSYSARGKEAPPIPVRVELTSPSGETWTFGDENATDVVRGTATDFCRVVTQRRHLSDTNLEVHGPAAQEWMGIAQAFAGPPGQGRRPGEFAVEKRQ